jgi:hypothetical protein
MLNHCLEFDFVQCHAFVNYYLVIVKFDTPVFSWYGNGIILKPQYHFMFW